MSQFYRFPQFDTPINPHIHCLTLVPNLGALATVTTQCHIVAMWYDLAESTWMITDIWGIQEQSSQRPVPAVLLLVVTASSSYLVYTQCTLLGIHSCKRAAITARSHCQFCFPTETVSEARLLYGRTTELHTFSHPAFTTTSTSSRKWVLQQRQNLMPTLQHHTGTTDHLPSSLLICAHI